MAVEEKLIYFLRGIPRKQARREVKLELSSAGRTATMVDRKKHSTQQRENNVKVV